MFDPHDHYWAVTGDADRVWSSSRQAYVPTDDAAFVAWQAINSRQATPMADEAQLDEYMRHHGMRGPIIRADDVRAECARRMRALYGARDDKHLDVLISNANREASRLQQVRLGVPLLGSTDPDPTDPADWALPPRPWTDAETQRAADLIQADAAIEALRAASNAMEAAPPVDFDDDSRWP